MGAQMVKSALNSRGFFSIEVSRYFTLSKTVLFAGPWYKFEKKSLLVCHNKPKSVSFSLRTS